MVQSVLRGRDETMAHALSALRLAAATGQGGVVAISGEPGVGKSAVLQAIVDEAAKCGFVVGTGKAERGDQIAAGAPLLTSLRSGPHPLLPGEAFASLALLYDKPLWLVDRISALLEELAERSPILIAIDDLRWADQLTRFALRVLPARLAGSPVVWVVTSRRMPSEPLDEMIAGADNMSTITGVSLGALTSSDVDEIASDRLGAKPSDEIRKLLGAVAGNPFWAVQVIEGAVRRLERGQGIGDLRDEMSAGARARLVGLSAQAFQLIRLTAVWGRTLTVSEAARLLGNVSEAQARLAAREALDTGLLGGTDGQLSFAHDLVREVIYADIPPEDRRALHRACARYEIGHGTSALAAAAHFRASAVPDDEEAIVALEQAAGECMTVMPQQAAELVQQAFALVSENHPRWLVAGTRTLEMLVNVQRDSEALAIAKRLLKLAREPNAVAQIELHACQALWNIGDAAQMERRAMAVVTLADVSEVLCARLASALALAATRTQSFPVAKGLAQSAMAEGGRLEDVHSQRVALMALIEAARNEGRHRVVLDLFGDLRQLSGCAYQAEEIRTLQHLDRYSDAEAILVKIRETHDAVDDRLLPSMLYAQMWQDYDLARFDAAEAGARTLLRLGEETRNFRFRLSARMVLTAVAVYRGELAGAAAMDILISMEDLKPSAGEALQEFRIPDPRLMRDWMLAGAGESADSSDFRDPWTWSPLWMRVLVRVGLDSGNREFANKVANVADTAAQRNPGVPTFAGMAMHIRALLADDATLLADAVLRASPRPLVLADALKDLGSVLLEQKRPDDAVVALVEAANIYQRAGAVSSSRAIADLLRSRGIRGARMSQPTPRPLNGWAALTPTELRVVELVSTGHTNRSAAGVLGVSTNTVNTHLRAVFRKLDVKSRVQLTIAARSRSAGTM